MAVKYQCVKCGRRFVEWGAEKLKFACPCAEEAELVRIGSPEDKASKKPSLKRAVRQAVPARPLDLDEDDDPKVAPDVEDADTDESDEVEEDEDAAEALPDAAEEDDEEALVESDDDSDDDEEETDDDSVEDLKLGDISGSLPAKAVDHADDEDWDA